MTEKPGSPNFNVVNIETTNTNTTNTSTTNTTNIEDALAQTTDTISTIAVGGFYEKDDVEYGTLQYLASSILQHDGAIVIDPNAPSPALDLSAYLSYVSTGPGRWVRKLGDRVPIEWFGAKKNDEEFDNALSIRKALESPYIKGRELFFSKGFYIIKSTITVKSSNITITGSGKYDTFIVGYKSGIAGSMISPMILMYPGSDNNTIKNIGFKPWNYPSRHESGWTDRFQVSPNGGLKFADDVKVVDRGINGGFPEFFELDLTDPYTQQLFPPHWYSLTPTTKYILGVGVLSPGDATVFRTQYRTISIAPAQSADIVDTFTFTNLPTDFDLEKWSFSVRIIQSGSAQKGGLTVPSSNSNALLPEGYDPLGVSAGIYAVVKYNFDSTFTVTFKFKSSISSDFSNLASGNMSGPNYIMPYALDLLRSTVNIEINNVFVDGMWYAGPPGVASGATNRIGIDDPLGMYSVKNIRVLNCNFENYCNDGISLKDVFDSWGPSIQTQSINNGLRVDNSQFRRGATSGVDIEGDNITLKNCKLIDIVGYGALRYGSRSFGVQQKRYLFKNCECSVDPKETGVTAAASIQRHLGVSSVKKVVYDSCTFFLASYLTSVPALAGIYIPVNSPDLLIVENCTFERIYRSIQISLNIGNLIINNCQSINTSYDNSAIIYTSGGAVIKGAINIRGYSFERNDNFTSKIFTGNVENIAVDKNDLIKCDVILSKTPTSPSAVILYDMYRDFFNDLNAINKNIIEHVITDATWDVTFGLGGNLSNFAVVAASQKYKYVKKNIEVYLKVTGDVSATASTTFVFTLPVLVASSAADLYGTCTFLSPTGNAAVGAVIYYTTSQARVRITPTGTGSSTFWIKCEYEF
jgi:hypothetical protein